MTDPQSIVPRIPQGTGQRYARHFTLPGFGMRGQEKLQAARVLCIGAGGLGSPALEYLAAAGVGTLGIVDGDHVDVSNLQRQIIHRTADVGTPKTSSAARFIEALNPHCAVETFETFLTEDNAESLLSGWDVVLDGTDNFAAKYLTADWCADLGIPLVWGSVLRWSGQASVFMDGFTLRDLFPTPPPPGSVPDCAAGGVLGVLPGVIGTIMATEAIKVVTGLGKPLVGSLFVWDGLTATARTFTFTPQEGTAALRHRPVESTICGTGPYTSDEESPAVHHADISTAQQFIADKITLVDVREPSETATGIIGDSTTTILAPLSALADGDFSALRSLDKKKPVAFYCARGGRSATAARLAVANGWRDVTTLDGGIIGWWTGS